MNCSQVLGRPFRLALSLLLALAEFGRYVPEAEGTSQWDLIPSNS